MGSLILARRYARALLEAGTKDDRLRWEEELEELAVEWDVLRKFLAHPHVAERDKLGLIEELSLSRPLANLLRLIISERRWEVFPSIVDEYHRGRAKQEGLREAVITTANPLSGKMRSRLVGALERQGKGPLSVKWRIDPSIGGGATIQLGDTLIDGSIRGRLQRLRKELVGLG